MLLLQRVAGNRAVSRAVIQRQKSPGRYGLTKQANLRADAPPTYPVLDTIPKGAHVQVEPKGARTSNFKAGHKTNEHSWSSWQSAAGLRSGWIEDSKLKAAPSLPTSIPAPSVPVSAPPPSTRVPSQPPAPAQWRPTAAVAIGGGKGKGRADKSMGSKSFQEGLEAEGLGDLDRPLVGNVKVTQVTPLDREKLKVTIDRGRLYTHDGKYRLDTEGGDVRYVLCRTGDDVELYVSQVFKYVPGADASQILTYPSMTSHAQVHGTVVGAGDIVISDGRITRLSNQSGTWHPRGSHLVTAMRALVRWGVLDAALVKRGGIEIRQFLPGTDDIDVDAGELVTLGAHHLRDL